MNKVYAAGCVILFLGLVWMLSPHILHQSIEESIDEEGHSSHYENIIYGGIATLIGISLVSLGNKKKEERKPENFVYLICVAAILSIGAGAIHTGLIQEHFEEWYGYGMFFVCASIAQIVYGLILIKNAQNGRRWGTFYIVGIIGNLLIIGLWLVSRTYGIPYFGPEAGEVESMGPVDILSKAIEFWLVIVLARAFKE